MVIFKNLLDVGNLDLQYGLRCATSGRIFCLCGCNGTFEPNEYQIICKDVFDLDVNGLPKVAEAIVPDKSITQVEMHKYGYLWDGMYPIRKEKAREMYLNGIHSLYRLYEEDTEGWVDSLENLEEHDGLFGIEIGSWEYYLAKADRENLQLTGETK